MVPAMLPLLLPAVAIVGAVSGPGGLTGNPVQERKIRIASVTAFGPGREDLPPSHPAVAASEPARTGRTACRI